MQTDSVTGAAGDGDAVARAPRSFTRQSFLAVAGGGAAAALYGGLALLDRPSRPTGGSPRAGYPEGQFQVAEYGVRAQTEADSGVDVMIPPVWNVVITAKLARPPTARDQRHLEAALVSVEVAYPYSPAGVFMLVGYGLPYFRSYVPRALYGIHLPRMADTGEPVLLDAVRFRGDLPSTVLEDNDLLFHLRSDSLETLREVQQGLLEGKGTLPRHADVSNLFRVTSVRTGFIGRGLPKRLAEQAQLPIAHAIPSDAPLFMGFTSTQRLGQATESAVTFDRPPDRLLKPLTTARPNDYFAGGTTLHVSHLLEDLEAWYALSYEERAHRMFHYNVVAPEGRIAVQTNWLNPNPAGIDAAQRHVIGHNEAVQRGSRTPEGQALQLRVDFNTMDPLDSARPHPGVHFLAFTPGSEIFHRSRRAMDATDLEGKYSLLPSANGLNSFIRATRRQNFLVPPRRHRAFPLVELA